METRALLTQYFIIVPSQLCVPVSELSRKMWSKPVAQISVCDLLQSWHCSNLHKREEERERGSTLVFPSRPPTAHPYYVTQPKEDVSSVQVQCSMPRGKATWADSEKFSSRNDFEFSVH